jgi:serine/threonine protein kinase
MEDKPIIIQLPFERIDDFLIQYVISDGNYAITLKAFQESLQRPVFIKLLKPTIENHSDWIRRFHQEARICAFLKHPNITEVYRMGRVNQFHYIAMEYIDGFTLNRAGVLPVAAVFYLARQILEGMQYIHKKGVIHRDLKPGNILVDTFAVVKISDFGLAYLTENTSQTLQGSLVGTPAYMAPEQITGDPLSAKTDLFALGAVLYELLSGRKAFAGDSYSSCLHNILHTSPPVLTEIPPELSGFVEELLAKEPEKRPENSAECLNRLNKMQHEPDKAAILTLIETLSSTKSEQIRPVLRNKRFSVKKMAIIVIVLLFVSAFLYWLPKTKQTQSKTSAAASFNDSIFSNEIDSLHSQNITSPADMENLERAVSTKTVPKEKISTDKDTIYSAEETTVNWGELMIDVKPWADVYINDQLLDSQVVKRHLTLQPDSYLVVLSHPNFAPRINRFELNPGDSKTISWSFLSEAGYLWIEVQPWAEVFLDGKYVDTTPLTRPVTCHTGDAVVELKHPNFPNHRQIVTITQGDTVALRVNLMEQ